MNKLLEKAKIYVTNFLKIQSIASAASLPILINWGIPISIMTFVGNFIFSPVLIIFLTLSSLILFTEILHIPNFLLINLLELTTSTWEYLISFGSKKWLLGFNQEIFASILIYSAIGILILKVISKVFLYIFITIIALTLINYQQIPELPPKGKSSYEQQIFKKLKIIENNNNKIQILDFGEFNKKRSPEKFITFELKPYLTKKYGTPIIENIKLYKPSKKSFESIIELCETMNVNQVIVNNSNKMPAKQISELFDWIEKRLSKKNIPITLRVRRSF